jgi:hypothetical protein
MKHETVKLPHGYTAEIHIDESPENPFEAWDCEPPIATFSEHRLTFPRGQDALDAPALLALLPAHLWESREGKRQILAALPCDPSAVFETMRGYYGPAPFREAVEEVAREFAPDSWRSAEGYFDAMEALCTLAGIACYSTVSNGYSQGHSARVFVAALPAWVELVGAPEDTHAGQCKAAAALWGAWAWGDVYGVARVLRPDGEEAPDGSCWGFYGTDHEQSGLLDHCRNAVDCDMAAREREAARAFEAACRDIETAA